MNDAELKEVAFLLGELNPHQLYTLIVAMMEVEGFSISTLKQAIEKLKELNEVTTG